MNKNVINFINAIREQLGFVELSQSEIEMIELDSFIDNGGDRNFIIRRAELPEEDLHNILDQVYDCIYGIGSSCSLRSRLTHDRISLLPFEDIEFAGVISILTICSVLYFSTSENSIQSVVAQLLGWVYDDELMWNGMKNIDITAYAKREPISEDEINQALLDGYKGL